MSVVAQFESGIGTTASSGDIRETTWAATDQAPAPKRGRPRLPVDPDGITREQRRSRRKRDVRARTVSIERMTKRELELGALLYPDEGERELRPVVRGECEGGVRPCVFVSCPFNLYLDVNPRTGAVKINFPDLEPNDMGESCCLDVADRGGTTLEDVGAIMNLTRERIRQLEVKAMAKLERAIGNGALREYTEGPSGKRRLPVLEAT